MAVQHSGVKNIVLFGVKHCGKSSVGRLLASRLARVFVDTDQLVLALFKHKTQRDMRLRQFIQAYGQATFVAYEQLAVRYCSQLQGAVIAVGGSTLFNKNNHDALSASGTLVYLQVSALTSFRRIQYTGLPTFLDADDPLYSFVNYYKARVDHYAVIADHALKADG